MGMAAPGAPMSLARPTPGTTRSRRPRCERDHGRTRIARQDARAGVCTHTQRFDGVQGHDRIPEDPGLLARAEREAINAPIQGTAADIIKIAMIRLPAAIRENDLQSRLLLQVHDELVLECLEADVAKTSQLVQEIMQRAYTLVVPLKTDAKAGPNWDAMEPLNGTGK